MSFEEWIGDRINVLSPQEYHALEAVWDYQEDRISNLKVGVMELEEKLEIAEKDIRYLNKRLKDANGDVAKIAKDNVQLRKELGEQEEPVECEQVVYVATHNIEEDTFYVGSLREIMEWCEEWNHGVSSLNFYRLGDEVRIGFVDMGKETRFWGK